MRLSGEAQHHNAGMLASRVGVDIGKVQVASDQGS